MNQDIYHIRVVPIIILEEKETLKIPILTLFYTVHYRDKLLFQKDNEKYSVINFLSACVF